MHTYHNRINRQCVISFHKRSYCIMNVYRLIQSVERLNYLSFELQTPERGFPPTPLTRLMTLFTLYVNVSSLALPEIKQIHIPLSRVDWA